MWKTHSSGWCHSCTAVRDRGRALLSLCSGNTWSAWPSETSLFPCSSSNTLNLMQVSENTHTHTHTEIMSMYKPSIWQQVLSQCQVQCVVKQKAHIPTNSCMYSTLNYTHTRADFFFLLLCSVSRKSSVTQTSWWQWLWSVFTAVRGTTSSACVTTYWNVCRREATGQAPIHTRTQTRSMGKKHFE